jgi:predicted RNA binding protein with dsRBD fold (UPF0201 family)
MMIVSVTLPRNLVEEWTYVQFSEALNRVARKTELVIPEARAKYTRENRIMRIVIGIPDEDFNEDILDSIRNIIKQEVGDYKVEVYHEPEKQKAGTSSPSQATGGKSPIGSQNRIHPIRIETVGELDVSVYVKPGSIDIATAYAAIELSFQQLKGLMQLMESVRYFNE